MHSRSQPQIQNWTADNGQNNRTSNRSADKRGPRVSDAESRPVRFNARAQYRGPTRQRQRGHPALYCAREVNLAAGPPVSGS